MKLNEWKDASGKKITVPIKSSSGNKTSSGGFKKRLEKLVDYHIAHKDKSVDKIVERYVADYGFIYSEHHGGGIGGYTKKITALIDKDENWEYSVFMDDKKLLQSSGKTWEKFVYSISDYLALPLVTSDPDYQELLKEWVDTSGKKINISSQNSSPAALVNSKDQTERYKKLLAKIDSEKKFTYDVKELSTRVLAIVIDNELIRKFVRIIYSPSKESYLVQISESPDVRCDYWKTVLQVLVGAGIIKNTSESLDNSSMAEEFKEYESLWD